MPNQFNLGKKTVKVVSSQALTASWVAGNMLDTDTCNFLGLFMTYTKGDEAGAQIKVEGTLDVTLGNSTTVANATNFYQRVVESTVGGKTSLTADLFELIASGNYSETIYPMKSDGVKISVQADTLGTSPGTITIYAVTSWV